MGRGGAFNKDTLRSISRSLGRFIAIAAIVALGTGFYAGLRMTAPDMNQSADTYYDNTYLMDIRVVSTLGLTDEDVDVLRGIEGVSAVMPAYETDVMGTVNNEQYAMRVHSLSESASAAQVVDEATVESDDPNYLNRLILTSGRWPGKPGECVISSDRVMNTPTELGDVIKLTECTSDLEDTLVTDEYVIVGYAYVPTYVSSTSMGSTTLGSGTIQQFMYVPETDFEPSFPYTEAYLSVDGARDERYGTQGYDEEVNAVMDRITAIAPEREHVRVESLRGDAQAKVDEARETYEAERNKAAVELTDAKTALDEAKAKLDQSTKDLEEAEKAYNEAVVQLEDNRKKADTEFAQAQSAIDQAQVQLDQHMGELASLQGQLTQIDQALAAIDNQVPDIGAAIAQNQSELANMQRALSLYLVDHPNSTAANDPRVAEMEQAIATLQENLRTLNEMQARRDELVNARASVEAAINQINTAANDLTARKAQLSEARTHAQREFDEAQKKLDETKKQIDESRKQLDQGKTEYQKNLATYNEHNNEAKEKLAQGENDLEQAQKLVDDLEEGEWLVMDRSKNYGAVSFEEDAERVDHIASVFPLIFFLVAALVALTTMTRMVDEERITIGTFKALGYSRARITSKYLIYAGIASLAGSIIGIGILSFVLPIVIMNAYGIIYHVPVAGVGIQWPIALLSCAMGVGVTLLATWAACMSTLRESPAALMLPPAPRAGKRILLERITPLWHALSFSWKVTMRNLFRYKKRFIMTIVGIAGCTALLLTGLGLSNSINDIIDKQYGELVHYNTVITFDNERAADEAKDDVSQLTQTATYVQETALVAQAEDGAEFVVTTIVPQDPATFQTLLTMRDRASQNPLSLEGNGALVTEKLATLLHAQVGDTITLAEQDVMGNATTQAFEVVVDGITENYIGNSVIMSAQAYEQMAGEQPAYASVFAVVDGDESARDAFTTTMYEENGIKTIAYNDEAIDTYRTMLRSVNMIVVVLVVAAALLAFIVLYNLTNINITERVREIATLKVLGFTKREVNSYIFREIIILVIIGALIGLGLGIFLEGFVITTAEVNQVMFGRSIHADSFIISFVLTCAFAVFVMFVMKRKLARINMVESLKSNE